jgi:hypothetical protein
MLHKVMLKLHQKTMDIQENMGSEYPWKAGSKRNAKITNKIPKNSPETLSHEPGFPSLCSLGARLRAKMGPH